MTNSLGEGFPHDIAPLSPPPRPFNPRPRTAPPPADAPLPPSPAAFAPRAAAPVPAASAAPAAGAGWRHRSGAWWSQMRPGGRAGAVTHVGTRPRGSQLPVILETSPRGCQTFSGTTHKTHSCQSIILQFPPTGHTAVYHPLKLPMGHTAVNHTPFPLIGYTAANHPPDLPTGHTAANHPQKQPTKHTAVNHVLFPPTKHTAANHPRDRTHRAPGCQSFSRARPQGTRLSIILWPRPQGNHAADSSPHDITLGLPPR